MKIGGLPVLWACAGALVVHLGAAWMLGYSFDSAGSDHLSDGHQAVRVRYVLPSAVSTTPDSRMQGAATSTVAADSSSVATSDDKTVIQGAGAEGGPTRRYFDVSEVDQPAMPTPDWALDADMLVRNGVRTLRVEVLVSDKGRAEKCTVQSMEPPRPTLHQAIARQVCATRLTPAMRQGVAVASVRHVEILLTQE